MGLAVCILGAVTGLFFAVVMFNPNNGLLAGDWVLDALAQPRRIWPYPTFGAVIAGLIFYVVLELKNSN
jgi:hypothetical protein